MALIPNAVKTLKGKQFGGSKGSQTNILASLDFFFYMYI